MKKPIRHILVAVGDVRHAPGNVLRKVGGLARAAGASIELFHCIAEPDRDAAAAETASRRLERLTHDASLRGLRVKCTTTRDNPPHEAIVRQVISSGADLVVAAVRPHRLGGQILLRNTDWELIRHCPTPLLLVKSHRPYQKPLVLAAVDPFHAHARPADLDARLLDMGHTFAQLLHGTLHAFHAYMPLISVAPVAVGTAPLIVLPPEAEEAHGRVIARSIDQLAATADIPPACRHVHMGDATGELSRAAKSLRAGLVVMGAVSRSALARLFIGNTAERVLDRLSCDVLIVKPRGFKTKVAGRYSVEAPRAPKSQRNAVRRSRGKPDPTVRAMSVTLPPLL